MFGLKAKIKPMLGKLTTLSHSYVYLLFYVPSLFLFLSIYVCLELDPTLWVGNGIKHKELASSNCELFKMKLYLAIIFNCLGFSGFSQH
jgi:hypothetical protein